MEYSLDKEFCYPLCHDLFRARYEKGHLGAVMVSDGKNQIIFLGLRKFSDEVEGDDFKGVCLWVQGILVLVEPWSVEC